MIFDLLTIKDLYNKTPFYPNKDGVLPFNQNVNGYEQAKKYEIEEGCYFEFRNSGYTSRVFTNLSFDHLTISEKYKIIHAMKITYRSNRGIHISGSGGTFKAVDAKASDTFRTVTVILDDSLNDIGKISILDEAWNLNPENVSEGFPNAGDYLIIKKIEFLTV